MNATQQLHDQGQRLWLDNITRALIDTGTLASYIRDLAVTGLTSNPTIFDQAIEHEVIYDEAIRRKAAAGKSGEALFFELALEDLTAAADMFWPLHVASQGVDGWVSLEVSPLLAEDAPATIAMADELYKRANRPNFFIKIPGNGPGLLALEESICAGIPVNVTLLFSEAQYIAAAEAYLRGIERRLALGLEPRVASVASIFVSRWDVAVKDRVPAQMQNRLGIAVAQRCYHAYRRLLASPRWLNLAAQGAMPQRLLWASTGVKDPAAADTLYVEALAAPDTINTLPEKTLLAFASHGKTGSALPLDGGDGESTIAGICALGIDLEVLANQLQNQGIEAFAKSWHALMNRISDKQQVSSSSPGSP